MVVKKNVNNQDIIPMLENFYGSDCIVRFIEFMDVGNVNFWNKNEVISLENILSVISEKYNIKSLEKNYTSEVAKRWSYQRRRIWSYKLNLKSILWRLLKN